MDRTTRSGRIFSSYMIDAEIIANFPDAEIIHTGIDLSDFLKRAMTAADLRAAALGQDFSTPDDEDEWEDILEVHSRPLSPVSELTASPRSASPAGMDAVRCVSTPISLTVPNRIPTSSYDKPDPLATDDDADDNDPTMPALTSALSVEQRRRRAHRYETRRRRRAKVAKASTFSPYIKPLRAKYDQGHREQPVEQTGFNTASAYTSKAGAWVGSRKGKGRRRRWTLAELKKFGSLHIQWDGR